MFLLYFCAKCRLNVNGEVVSMLVAIKSRLDLVRLTVIAFWNQENKIGSRNRISRLINGGIALRKMLSNTP